MTLLVDTDVCLRSLRSLFTVCFDQDEDIAGQLGLAASEDGKLDDLADQAETEIINGDMAHTSPIGAIAPMVSILCSNSLLMQQVRTHSTQCSVLNCTPSSLSYVWSLIF